MSEEKTSGWAAIAALVLVVPATVWYGYVLSVLWAWFVVPAFEAPPLSIPYAIGIALLVGMFTRSLARSTDVKKHQSATTRFFKALGESFLGPLLTLGIGAIVRLFV